MNTSPTDTLTRREIYPRPLIDGREAPNGTLGRLRRRLQALTVSQREREEAQLERQIRTQPGVTRPNTVALISPKGGVGKTTCTFAVGNLIATHLKLRVIAVDANPDFGTLGRLAPDALRCERSLADLLEDLEELNTAAALRPYVSCLPTGLHLLSAPRDANLTASLGPERYDELLAFLARFYEVVLLDLGTGVAGPLARFAIEHADQVVLVTTPGWITSSVVLDALSHLQHDRTTVAINQSHLRPGDHHAIEERFRAQHLHRSILIPHDHQLAAALDTGTYTLEALQRPTRTALKELGLAVAEQLV
jgi:MinD-like ATPase involved in chromosome partitioning or flagellar assembly